MVQKGFGMHKHKLIFHSITALLVYACSGED